MNRTSDTTFRKRVLYPLSYGATAISIISQTATGTKRNYLMRKWRVVAVMLGIMVTAHYSYPQDINIVIN